MIKIFKDKKTWYILLPIIIYLIVLILTNKNTMAIQAEDNLSITCPSSTAPGQTIKCEITANINTITALSVDAYFDVTEGTTFKNFTSGSDWSNYASSENGFKLGNVQGITGKNLVGTVEYSIPTNTNLSECVISLVDAKFSDSNFQMLYLGDTEVKVKILSGKDNLPDNNDTVSSSTEISSSERLPASNLTEKEPTNNVQTGNSIFYLIIIIGFASLIFTVYYFYNSVKKQRNI